MATLNEIMQKYGGYQKGSATLLSNEAYRDYLNAQYEEAHREKNQGGFWGGAGYIFEQLGLGALSVVEGIWDFTAGGLADLFGADQWAEEQFANDWVNYNHANEWYNPTDGMRVAGDVASGIGNTLVGVGVGLATGGSGWVVMGTVGLGAAGNATKEAYKKTGELGWKEYGYGILSGATEAALEKVTGGTERMIKNLSKSTAKTVVKKSLLKEIGKDFISEAFEEGMSEFLDPYYQRWTQVDPEAKNATWQQVGYSALVGGLSGMLGGRLTAGIGSADSAIRATKRGGKIASNPEQLKNTVETATRVADYETEHNTGKGIYQHIKGLVDKFKGLDKGNGVVTLGQKRLLGEMERANIAVAYEPEVEKSKQKILEKPEEFIKAVNEKGLLDGTGKPIHIESVEALKSNSELLTHFAVADALGQILRSGNSVYDLVMSKGTTDGIVQAEFRRLQKEGNAQQKAAMNETFGIDIDSITYEKFIDKVQSTSRDVMISKQTAIKTRKQAKDAISHAINTNANIGVLDSNTAFAEGMSVFKTKDGKYVSVSKQGDSYYLYADGNISLPLTKAKLKSTIKALNGEQTQTKPKKKKPTTTQATATTQGTQTTAPVVTPQVAPSSDTTPTPTTTAPTTETGVNKPQTATPSNQSTETRTGEETAENKPKATNSTEDTTTTKPKAKTTEESSTVKPTTEDTTAQAEDTTKKPKAPAKPETPKSTKAPNKATARRGVIRIVMSKDNKATLRGAAVKDGKQYVSDGFFAARYTDILEGVTEVPAKDYPFEVFDRVIKENADATAEERVQIDADAIRALVPTKKAEYSEKIMRIGKNLYQLPYVSKIIDSITNPQVFLKKKGDFNPIYIKGDNGEAVFLPIRLREGQVKPVYEADYANYTDADKARAQKEREQKALERKKQLEKERAEREAEDKKRAEEYEKSRKEEKQRNIDILATAEKTILDGGMVKSENVRVYKDESDLTGKESSTFVALLDKYGVSVPIKTRGWIIENMKTAKRLGGEGATWHIQFKKGATASKSVTAIMEKLYQAIAGTQQTNETATATDVTTEKKTAKTSKTTKTEDFGEKIGGARKDTWQKRGLLTSDLTAMNRRELQQHVKKENVWKRPDFVKAIAEGGDRATLYIQNELYKSINATPYIRRSVATDTTSTAFQEAMEKYVTEIREVQKLAEGVKSKEDLSKITKWLIEKGYLNDTGSAYSRYSWTEAYYNSPALYGSKIFETTRKLEKGFDSLAETALMEGFGVDKADKLPNGYTIKRINSFWDNAGTKYVIVKGGKHGSYASPYFTSYEEAFAYGKEKFGTAETATAGTDGKKQRYVPPQLKDVHRDGADYRKGKNAVGDDFLRDFGIKGGEFGNWLSETDRTTSLNYGYDAFCDLADALGIELTDISLNGTLSIGFGSRGKGLSGAAAHYEPARKVINLTKRNGAGSLAHEFWHAVEDYASGDTHQHDMASDFSKMPERTRQAGRALLNAINYKDKVVEIDELNENRAKALERNLRHLERHLNSEFKIFGESMTAEDRAKEAKMYRYKRTPTDAELKRFDELRAQAVKGVSGVYNKFFAGEQTIVDELNALLKDVKGRGMDKDSRRTLALYIEQASSYSEQAVETQTKRVKTQFHEDALAISKTYAKDGGYWDSNCEMLARAFASYIHTKTDGKNDYLSGHALGAVPVVDSKGNISVAYTYPHDTAEAEAIYKAFDDFFAAAKADGLFHEATRTKPTTTVRYAMSEDTQLNTTPNGSKGQKLKPLQMKHAENVARNNIKGYENLTEAEKLEVEWTLASAWRAGKSTTEALNLARLSTAIGAGVGFADITTKTTDGRTVTPDAACYTRGGHLTIYLNPNGKRTVETATLHELAHSLEGMEGYEDIKAMAEKYYAEHPEEKKAIDDMYREVYKNEQVRYAEEILPSELTAHYVESMLSKRDMLAKLTKENPTFTQKCIEKIKAIRNKLTKADKNAKLSEVDMLETRFITIFNLNKGKIATNSNLSGVKLSIKKINGKDTVVVDTDQHIFDGVERADLGKTVSAYMKERYRGRVVNGLAFTAQSEREYTHSRDSKRLFNQANGAYEAKMRASTELNNLIITGEFMQDETAKHPQRINEGGVKRYKVSFVMSDKVFEGEMIIAIDKNGVGTFYDIVKIKESDSSNDAPNGVVRTNALSANSISETSENVNPETAQTTKKFALSAKNSKFNVEDFLFDDDYYATYQYESREQITETIEELEKVKASKSFESMSFDEQYEITSKIKALKAGYTTLYDYIVETDKQRLLDDWQYHIEKGVNNRASRMVEEKLKRIEKEEKLQADISNATKLQNAQYEIIQKSNPMFDDYHVGIRSPKDIKTFAEVIDDTDSFNWGDFTREDAQNALKRGKVRVFSSYPIKNGVFVSTSYQQALDYAGGNPNGVHSREVALESVAWINGDEGQYAKVYSYSDSGTVRYALSPEDIKGSDRVTTELPDKKVRLRDVITGKSTFGELKGQIKGGTSEQTEAFKVLMTNAQAAVERVAGEMGVTDATAWTNFVRAGKNASFNAIEENGGQYSLDGEIKVGDSLGRIWQPIYAMDKKDGQALKMFDTYLLHWHNIDRMAIGKPVFGDDVTVDDSMAEIEKIEAEYPEFRRIAEKVWRFNDNNLQLSVDSGMYSQEYADHLRELYPHYVPTMRTEHRTKVNALMGKNSLFVNNAKKKAKGSDAEILPIDDQIAAQTIQKTTSARINAFLVKMLESGKHDEFQILSSEDADIDIDTETEVTTYEDKAKGTHQVTFYHDGKKVTAQVSKLVYKGIEAFRPSSSMSDNIAVAVVQKLNSLFKKGVTSWNPFFSFFKNPMRDLQDALLYTRYSHATYLKNLNRARQEISSNGRYWQEAKAAGITSSSVYDYEKGVGYKEKGVFGKAKEVMRKVENASNAIEMAPRLAEYISARESGLSVQEALLQAQDVTTNFGRGGTFAKILNSTVMPFLNPSIQGFSKMWRSYVGKEAAQSWINLIIRSLLLGIGMTALNDLLNGDDEEYEGLSDYVKEQNYVIALGDGDFLKIPKGRVTSVFGGAFLRGKRYANGDADAWEGYWDSVKSAVTPVDNFTRTIFSPFNDISTNTAWHGGTIESQKWDNTEPKNRYDETTSSIAIWLGQVFNYSPIKIDYLLEQYGGIVADIALPATSTQAEKGIISQNMLANSTLNSKWSNEFYTSLEDYTYKKTAGDLQAKGVVRYLNSVKSTVSDLYTQKSSIQADKDLSNDEKLTQTKIIQTTINALQQEAVLNTEYLYNELGKYNLSTDEAYEQAYLDCISVIMGAEYALQSYNKDVYSKAVNLNKLGVSYETYYDYYFGVKSITSDKNADGSTVSGSKKAKVIAYTMAQNMPTAQKIILIMNAGYTIADGDISGMTAKQAKTAVAKYITNLKVSRAEKEELAKMFGFTVKLGKIYIN